MEYTESTAQKYYYAARLLPDSDDAVSVLFVTLFPYYEPGDVITLHPSMQVLKICNNFGTWDPRETIPDRYDVNNTIVIESPTARQESYYE